MAEELLTAAQAHETTEAVRSFTHGQQVGEALNRILESIRSVADRGFFGSSYSFDPLEFDLVDDVRAGLLALGYSVSVKVVPSRDASSLQSDRVLVIEW